jgi:hypothetical protein
MLEEHETIFYRSEIQKMKVFPSKLRVFLLDKKGSREKRKKKEWKVS